MAKIQRIEKSRKIQKCNKCNKEIPVGSAYLKAEPYMRPAIIRCTRCGLESYETSSSSFIQAAGRIACHWADDYSLDEDGIATLISELESLRDECEYSLDNIPDQLKDADAGALLQERIDMLEDVIGELESIDVDGLKAQAVGEVDFSSIYDEESEDDASEFSDSDYDGLLADTTFPEHLKFDLTECFENALSEEIESALSSLQF